MAFQINIEEIQIKRGTASEWTSENPILLEGELGWEKDTNKLKIGDGINNWGSLTYLSSGGGGGGGFTQEEIEDIVATLIKSGTSTDSFYTDNGGGLGTINIELKPSLLAKLNYISVSSSIDLDLIGADVAASKAKTDNLPSSQNAVNDQVQIDLADKQALLVSGTTIKTIDGNSILGAGNIVTTGGGGTTNIYNNSYLDKSGGSLVGVINGVNTVFTVSQGEYRPNSLIVYREGQALTAGVGLTETTPASGIFTLDIAPNGEQLVASYEVGSIGGGGGGDLSATDIDTLAELNAIITDATLIDTTDSRLSDARTPTAHTHDHTEITDYDTELAGTTNTTAFTPTADYHPATKKYVDDEIAGSGDVTKVGTPVDNQLAIWTGDGTIEGDSMLIFDNISKNLTIDKPGTSTAIGEGGIYFKHNNGIGTSRYHFGIDDYDIFRIKRDGDTTGDGDAWSLINLESPNSNNPAVDNEATLALTSVADGTELRALDIYYDSYSRDNGAGMRLFKKSGDFDPIRFEHHDKTTNNGAFVLGEIYGTSSEFTFTSIDSEVTGVTPSVDDWIWDNGLLYFADDTKIISVTPNTPSAGITTYGINRALIGSPNAASARGKNIKEIMRLSKDRQLLVRKFIAENTTNVAEFGGNTTTDGDIELTGGVKLRTGGSSTDVFATDGSVLDTSGLGGGSGDVSKVGTPSNGEIGVWTGDGTLGTIAELNATSTVLNTPKLVRIDALTGNPEFDLLENGTKRAAIYYNIATNQLVIQNNESNAQGAVWIPENVLIGGDLDMTSGGSNKIINLADPTNDQDAVTKAYVDTEVLTAKSIPQNSQSTAYTLVLSDAGKHILHPSADTTARTFTIPANASVAFPIGTTVSFVNQNGGGDITIAITSDTMRLAGDGSTGSRTLTENGIATAIKVTSTEWLITGTNLS